MDECDTNRQHTERTTADNTQREHTERTQLTHAAQQRHTLWIKIHKFQLSYSCHMFHVACFPCSLDCLLLVITVLPCSRDCMLQCPHFSCSFDHAHIVHAHVKKSQFYMSHVITVVYSVLLLAHA